MYVPLGVILLVAPLVLVGIGIGLLIAVAGSVAIAKYIWRHW